MSPNISPNLIDKAVGYINPRWGLERLRQRQAMALYEAGTSKNPNRTRQTDRGDADHGIAMTGYPMLQLAREAQENYDVLKGAINTLESRIVGAGLETEPTVLNQDGELNSAFNAQLKMSYQLWFKQPMLSSKLSGGDVQRLQVNSGFRDGETFTRFVSGKGVPHKSPVPLSLELMESEQLPWNQDPMFAADKQIILGIERDRWSRPKHYYFHKVHPGANNRYTEAQETWRIPSHQIVHYYHQIRANASRGISGFHATFRRLSELRDYENSEMVAAKMAAALGIQIKRHPDMISASSWDTFNTLPGERLFRFQPGMIADHLAPGEEIEPINPNNRPNNGLNDFRKGHLHLAARGIGFMSYSSLMGEYNGSYSAERQAMVESWMNLAPLIDHYVNTCWQPIYERVVETIIINGLIELPADIDIRTLFFASHRSPTMPYIDPLKEARAKQFILQNGLDSWSNMVRSSGRNPNEVKQEIMQEKAFLDQYVRAANDAKIK